MPQMRAFLENFSPEQVRESPLTCKVYWSERVAINLLLFASCSLQLSAQVYRASVYAEKGIY